MKKRKVTIIGNDTNIVIKIRKPASKSVKANRDKKKQNARGR